MRQRNPPIQAYLVAAICLALFVISLMAACTNGQRQDTLRASIITVDTARDGFIRWDRAHQQAIAENATSRDDVEAKIAAYRAHEQRDIALSFEVAYRAIGIAATQTDQASLSGAVRAVAELLASIKALSGDGGRP